LNQPVFQVTSTTSQIKYNPGTFFVIKFLSSSFKSTQPQVAFASFQDLQSCKPNSIFSSFKSSFSKNLFIFFVDCSVFIFNSTFIFSKIYLILSCSEFIFILLKYSHKEFQVLKTIGQLIPKCVNKSGQNSVYIFLLLSFKIISQFRLLQLNSFKSFFVVKPQSALVGSIIFNQKFLAKVYHSQVVQT
jgi:hypothetical protein